MKKIIITESQYNNLLSNQRIEDNTIETIRNFTNEEREMFLSILEYKYPSKLKKNIISESQNISESEWYNLVGDIAGIFDPTGLVDAANAVSYFSQGEILFGMLSLVSVVPYIGDALAKPVVMGAKLSGAALKPLQVALKSKNTLKIGETLTKLEKGGGFGKKVVDFFRGFGDSSLISGIKGTISKVKNLPGGKQLAKLVDDWVKIFRESSKQIGKTLPKANKKGVYITPGGSKFIKTSEANKLFGKAFADMIVPFAGSANAFRSVGKAKRFKGTTSLFSGQNPLREMLNRTKVWGHFLEWAGFEDSNQNVDKVLAKYGEKATGVNFEKFINSPDGKKAVKDEFGQTLKDLGEDAILSKLGINL